MFTKRNAIGKLHCFVCWSKFDANIPLQRKNKSHYQPSASFGITRLRKYTPMHHPHSCAGNPSADVIRKYLQ